MTHEDIQDLLEPYVDETLDRRRRAEVDRHLAGCEECRTILEGIPAVQLGRVDFPGFDERAMRRAVRATLLRLAVNVVVVGLAALLVVTLIGFLIVQPLVVNRGGRAAAATQATEDLAVMFNPGAAITETQHESGVIRRTSEATAVLPVGTSLTELGTLETRIGPLAFGGIDGGDLFPYLADSGGAGAETQLPAVSSGTVATVEVYFDPPLDLQRAQELADSPIDVRVVWAGFATADGPPIGIGLEAGGIVGYATCDQRGIDAGFLSATSGGSGRSPYSQLPSIDRALEATRASLDNLIAHPDLIDGIAGASRNTVTRARDYLGGDPGVHILVVTGPTPEVLRLLDEAGASNAGVRGIEFTNWFQPLCGR